MDDAGLVTEWNRQAETAFGWSRDEALGKRVADLVIPVRFRSAHRRGLRRFLDTRKTAILGQRLELCALHRDGREFPVELSVWATQVGSTYAFSAFVHDISERKRLEAELINQALHDPLTGLANRTLLLDRMTHALDRSERSASPMTVLFLDLDGFKRVNDSLGHSAGDKLLVAVAERLRGFIRPADTIARIGGDEFAVLLEDTGAEVATGIAERLGRELAVPFAVGGREVLARASIGIAIGSHGRAAEELLRDADLAMYIAKRQGKGGQAVFEGAMHTAALERLELEAELSRALAADEIVIYYQPVIRLADGALTGMEALVRWNRPGHGLVSPAAFIPVAEETGLITAMGRWVLDKACSQLVKWQGDHGLSPAPHLSVNLSARQLEDPELRRHIEAALSSSGLDPRRLVLEITESALMEEPGRVVEQLHILKQLGIRLAIDDFGTGYSSLSYLRRFPVDVLKIDKALSPPSPAVPRMPPWRTPSSGWRTHSTSGRWRRVSRQRSSWRSSAASTATSVRATSSPVPYRATPWGSCWRPAGSSPRLRRQGRPRRCPRRRSLLPACGRPGGRAARAGRRQPGGAAPGTPAG
jgi:diguanylate cyclase (GGDEF)-like protein/PAS domain S-box-containing protein